MIVLGIETSCDETSAAVLEGKKDQIFLRSNIVASSLAIHAKTGGVIPENAAREQVKWILPVIEEALKKAFKISNTSGTFNALENIDAIAVTFGPGLIGSLLVGVETAKTIAFAYNIPIIPINHMIGHIYANWIENQNIVFPAIALVVSGGHTDLLFLKNHNDYKLLGGTRDDAAGEAFDKIGRLLRLSYPAGPAIEKRAEKGASKRFRLPRPLIGSGDFEFSFSGLKTAVLRETQSLNRLDDQTVNDLSYATQDAIIDVLVKKTVKAAEKYHAKSILLSGGVAANQKLRETLEQTAKSQKLTAGIFVPEKSLCTDNAAMIASAAYFGQKPISWEKITANPELYFE